MALTTAYLMTTKNLEDFLNAIRGAKAPERFTYRFLENLGFTSTNDRLFISLLKGIGFLDENAAPTQKYFDFLDQSQSGTVLADALREAYSDLFAVNTKASEMSVSEVKNKLKTLTRGEKTDKVAGLMANTFRALADLADWDTTRPTLPDEDVPTEDIPIETGQREPKTPLLPLNVEKPLSATTSQVASHGMNLHYNIQIHLPESRDPAVYDAIFQSLRRHLM